MTLLVNVLTCALFVLASHTPCEAEAEEAVNFALIDSYVRLGQQLRKEINQIIIDTNTRTANIRQVIISVEADLLSAVDASSAFGDVYQGHDDIVSSAGLTEVHTMTLNTHEAFAVQENLLTSIESCHLKDLESDYGMAWATNDCMGKISRGGVYLLDFKMQGKMRQIFNFKFEVLDGSENVKYSHQSKNDWELTPEFFMMRLDAGDTVHLPKWRDIHQPWYFPREVMTGPANQLTLRFLGSYVPHLQSTTPMPTTANPYGPFPGFPPFAMSG